jgi:hypothetical protein
MNGCALPAWAVENAVLEYGCYQGDPACKIRRRCLSAMKHKRCAKAAPYEHDDCAMVGFAALTATLLWR